MSLVIRGGWDQRHQPLKAPLEQVAKLNRRTIYMYCASHNRAPFYRHGLGQQPTRKELIECLIRQNLVANTPSPNLERGLSPNLLPGRVFPYVKDTRFLFIVTPDCMLITLEFQDTLVQLDDIKKNYVELLRDLHDQFVPADRVRLFLNDKFKKSPDKKIVNIDKMTAPCLHAMHLEPFQIFVESLELRTISLMVMPCTTLLELKKMIQDKVEIPPERWYIRLHWTQGPEGHDDNLCISHYNIQKNDTIRLVFRLLGGGKRARTSASEEAIPKFIGVPQVKDL